MAGDERVDNAEDDTSHTHAKAKCMVREWIMKFTMCVPAVGFENRLKTVTNAINKYCMHQVRQTSESAAKNASYETPKCIE